MTAVRDNSVVQFGELAFDVIRELQRECRERDEKIAEDAKLIEELRKENELLRLHLRQTQDPREH